MNLKSSFIEENTYVKRAPTLVRRFSDMFKGMPLLIDGTYSGPPSLFCQKIRHCCENLNLLHSVEMTKSHPFAMKVNSCFDLILKNFVARLLFIYASLRRSALTGLQRNLPSKKKANEDNNTIAVNGIKSRLQKFQRQKPKQNPTLLVVAIYLAPIVLALQLIGLCSLLVIGKYTPGFVFLMSSLFLLAYIVTKIMFHDAVVTVRRKKEKVCEKRKQE